MLLPILLCFQSTGHATSFYIRPFSEFTQSAPLIVLGTLRNVHVENGITEDGSRTIFTMASLEVREILKGSIRTPTLTVKRMGGTKDGMTLEIPGSPDFKEGEESVMFLGPELPDQSHEVVGMELGKFGLIEKNGETTLTGGIFEYHDDAHTNKIEENQKTWSMRALKALIAKQGNTPAITTPPEQTVASKPNAEPSPTGEKRDLISPQDPQTNDSLNPTAKTEESALASNSKHMAPFILGIGSAFLALFMYLRRRR